MPQTCPEGSYRHPHEHLTRGSASPVAIGPSASWVAARRRASLPSALLAMQKVDGSSRSSAPQEAPLRRGFSLGTSRIGMTLGKSAFSQPWCCMSNASTAAATPNHCIDDAAQMVGRSQPEICPVTWLNCVVSPCPVSVPIFAPELE